MPLPRFLDTTEQPLALLCSHLFLPIGPDGKQPPGPPERTAVFYGVGTGGSDDGTRWGTCGKYYVFNKIAVV